MDAFGGPSITYSDIAACSSISTLLSWSLATRQHWLLTKRTIEGRRLHHFLFYEGGDDGHQAFLQVLYDRQAELEERLLQLDDRAYDLLVQEESAEWLAERVQPADACGVDTSDPHGHSDGRDSVCDASHHDTTSTVDNVGTLAEQEAVVEELDSDISSTPTQRECSCKLRILKFFSTADSFTDTDQPVRPELKLANDMLENIIRYVISRTPRVLVRARASSCKSVRAFLENEDGSLQDEDYQHLCRALTYAHSGRGGLIAPKIMRDAICDAENPEEAALPNNTSRTSNEHVAFLGGKVWRKPLRQRVSPRGWDLFYRFVPCKGCVSAVVQTFSDWSRVFTQATLSGRYPNWAGENLGIDTEFRHYGAILSSFESRGKLGKVETIKPRVKGKRSVSLEKDSRNYIFLRFDERSPLAPKLKEKGVPNAVVWLWPATHSTHMCMPGHESVWQTRVRSAYTPAQRKVAKWSRDRKLDDAPCTHRRALEGSYEMQMGRPKVFREGALDAFIIDTSSDKQDFKRFTKRIIDTLKALAEDPEVNWNGGLLPDEEKLDLHDKAFLSFRVLFVRRCDDCETYAHTRRRRYATDCWATGGVKALEQSLKEQTAETE